MSLAATEWLRLAAAKRLQNQSPPSCPWHRWLRFDIGCATHATMLRSLSHSLASSKSSLNSL